MLITHIFVAVVVDVQKRTSTIHLKMTGIQNYQVRCISEVQSLSKYKLLKHIPSSVYKGVGARKAITPTLVRKTGYKRSQSVELETYPHTSLGISKILGMPRHIPKYTYTFLRSLFLNY